MSWRDKDSTFRRRGRKISNTVLLINAIGALVVVIVMFTFLIWIFTQA